MLIITHQSLYCIIRCIEVINMFVYLVNIVNHIGSFKRFLYYIISRIYICSSFILYNYCDETEKKSLYNLCNYIVGINFIFK